MYQIIIASHGPMAEAMKASLEFVMGPAKQVNAFCLNEEGISRFGEKLDAFIEAHKTEEVLAFVDLMYGTPFNELAKRAGRFENDFEMLTGLNLPGLAEAVQNQTENKKIAEIIPLIREASAISSFHEMLEQNELNSDDE